MSPSTFAAAIVLLAAGIPLAFAGGSPPSPPAPWQLSSSDDLVYLQTAVTESGYVELFRLLADDNYQNQVQRWPLKIKGDYLQLTNPWYTSSPFTYLLGNNNDLYVIKYKGESGTVELHILPSDNYYSEFTLDTALGAPVPFGWGTYNSPFTPSPANMKFALGSNNDLYVFLVNGTTGTDHPEVHVLTADSQYQSLGVQVGIAMPYPEFRLTDPWYTSSSFNFLIGSNNDLYLIKYRGATNTVEVHILSAASNYQSFILETATPLAATEPDAFNFRLDAGDNLYCIKYENTGSDTVEVHILSRESNFQSFVLQKPTAFSIDSFLRTTFVVPFVFPNADPIHVSLGRSLWGG